MPVYAWLREVGVLELAHSVQEVWRGRILKGGAKGGGGAVGMVHTMEGKGKETQKRRYGCAEEKVLI